MFPSEQPVAATESAASAGTLQFRKAEMAGEQGTRVCSVCRQAIGGEYYQVNGAEAHGVCTQQVLAIHQRRGGAAEFGRAVACGLGAAISGSISFMIVTYTHIPFRTWLSILIGIVVAKAIVYGSRGCRGRRYQVLAVLLTYGSITTSYVPLVAQGFSQAAKKAQEKKGIAQNAASAPAETQKVGAAGLAVGTVFLFVFSLAAPLVMLGSAWGWFNLLIIAFGLMRAWRGTAAIATKVTGPFAATL